MIKVLMSHIYAIYLLPLYMPPSPPLPLSLSLSLSISVHTGLQFYNESLTKIPTACITIEDAEMLYR